MSSITEFQHAKLEGLRIRWRPMNHHLYFPKDTSSMDLRVTGRKAFGSIEHRALLTITFGYYILVTGNPTLGAIGIYKV